MPKRPPLLGAGVVPKSPVLGAVPNRPPVGAGAEDPNRPLEDPNVDGAGVLPKRLGAGAGLLLPKLGAGVDPKRPPPGAGAGVCEPNNPPEVDVLLPKRPPPAGVGAGVLVPNRPVDGAAGVVGVGVAFAVGVAGVAGAGVLPPKTCTVLGPQFTIGLNTD